jgi:hypothetical protein
MTITPKSPRIGSKKRRVQRGTARFPRIFVGLDDLRCLRPFMADFFKVMRNHRVACLLTMQQEEQWDLLNLAPMKNVIRGLLSLKMFYRPETFETAEKMALILNRYDAMGDVRPYTTKTKGHASTNSEAEMDGWADTESESAGGNSGSATNHNDQEGWQLTPRVDADGNVTYLEGYPTRSGGTSTGGSASEGSNWNSGTAKTKSGATTKARAETDSESATQQLHIVSAKEQVYVDAQHLLSYDMQRHDAVVRWEDADGNPKAAFVHVAPFEEQPAYRAGRPVLEQYRAAVARVARRRERTPYVARVEPPAEASASAPVTQASGRETDKPVSQTSSVTRPVMPAPPRSDLFPPRAGDLVEREMRTVYTLEAIANVHLCTVQILMLLFRWSYDKAYRELEALVNAGCADRIRGFAARGQGSVPTTYVLNSAGATFLAEHGRDRDELQRVAKNLAVYRRAIEENRPTQERHRSSSAMLLALLVASARSVDPEASVSDIRFDRERTIGVDLAQFADRIGPRERPLVTPDPTKTSVSYVPDFSYVVRWRIDGRTRVEPVFGEVETGFGERDGRDAGAAKAWKIRALLDRFRAPFTLGDTTFEPGTMPRVVVWCRTAALEQRFFEGARGVFGDTRSPLWLTNGEHVPLAIPTGTSKKDMPAAMTALAGAIQTKAWRWLRFPKPDDRRRFVGTGEHS